MKQGVERRERKSSQSTATVSLNSSIIFSTPRTGQQGRASSSAASCVLSQCPPRRSGNVWTGIRKTSLWRGALASVLPGPLQRPYPVDGVALCWVTGGLLVDPQDDAPGCVMPSPSALGWLCKDASMGQHGSAMRLFNVPSTVQGSTRTYLLEAVSALTGNKGEQWYQKAGR